MQPNTRLKFNYGIDEVFEWFEEAITDKTVNEMVEVMMDTKIFGNSINQGINRNEVGKKKPSKK